MFSTSAIGVPFLTQNIYFLITVGLNVTSVFDIGIGGFFLGCLFVMLGWLSNEGIGRRRLWLWGLIGNFLCMVTIGALGFSTTKASQLAIAVIMSVLPRSKLPRRIYLNVVFLPTGTSSSRTVSMPLLV